MKGGNIKILILLPLLPGFGGLSTACLHNSSYVLSWALLEVSASPQRVLWPLCHANSHGTGKATASYFGSLTTGDFITNNSYHKVIDNIRITFFCLHRSVCCFFLLLHKANTNFKMFLKSTLNQKYIQKNPNTRITFYFKEEAILLN